MNFKTKTLKPRSLNKIFGEYGSLGLDECSTNRQKVNGTFMFRDTHFDDHEFLRVFYTFHPVSGYFRRKIYYVKRRSTPFCINKYDHYQLNRVRTEIDTRTGYEHTQRIKIYNLAYQMELALSSIKRYRKTQNV
jgi:hypothetical protein